MPEMLKLTKKPILEVLSAWVGIPVKQLDSTSLNDEGIINLKEKLNSEIFGQDIAIEKVCNTLKRRFILSDATQNEMRPIATLLFVGGSGTGKTELATQISEHFFGSTKNLIRIDSGNYAEEHSISKLIGSPPGYVGFGDGGQLTNALRKTHFAVILFDEIEKAHPKIITDILIQLSANGTITDGNNGTLLDATNTIIILTSNLGSSFNKGYEKNLGFILPQNNENARKNEFMDAIRAFLPNEIIGRIDDIIIFNALNKEAIHHILLKEIKKLENKLAIPSEPGGLAGSIQIQLSDAVENIFIQKIENDVATQGARAIQRVFNHYVMDQIMELKIKGAINSGESAAITIALEGNGKYSYTVV